MTLAFHVKTRLLAAAAALCLSGFAGGEEAPDARAILKSVRAAQAAQQQSLTGRVRSGWKSVPFKLTMSGNTIRWEFSDPSQTLQLRLGERLWILKEVRSEQMAPGKRTYLTPSYLESGKGAK